MLKAFEPTLRAEKEGLGLLPGIQRKPFLGFPKLELDVGFFSGKLDLLSDMSGRVKSRGSLKREEPPAHTTPWPRRRGIVKSWDELAPLKPSLILSEPLGKNRGCWWKPLNVLSNIVQIVCPRGLVRFLLPTPFRGNEKTNKPRTFTSSNQPISSLRKAGHLIF